jgi:GNAT superfamily N-acetyltransferase
MGVTIRELGEPGDLGWVVLAHGELYHREYGWDVTFEELVAGIVGQYATSRDPERERAWVAEVDGERAGCVFCMAGEGDTARLRILLVDPKARGLGLGATLVDRSVEFARSAGYRRMTLWTNAVLVSARRIYEAAGFELVAEESHHSFGHDLTGQTWELDLDRLE